MKSTAIVFILSGLIALSVSSNAQEFTENNASNWGTFASDGASRSVSNDTIRVKVGNYSIRFDTLSGFDTGVKFPANQTTNWKNLSDKNYLVFWEYAVNNTQYGFQDNQPIIILRSSGSSYFRYEALGALVYNKVWHKYMVPLAGDSMWVRTTVGSPSMSNITQIEIHHDTWDYGFTIYFDGMEFINWTPGTTPPAGPNPPPGVHPYAIEPRVLLYIYNPIREDRGGIRLNQVYGWYDPAPLTNQVMNELRDASHDLARYKIIETVIADEYPKFKDGYVFTDAAFDNAWTTRTEYPYGFDYAAFAVEKGIVPRVASGDVDEVWVYAMPFTGFWESNMVGNGGYWCNSGPTQLDSSERMFIVMGWNYERYIAEALESYGHRSESIMVHSYGSWQVNENTTWNKFTLYDKIYPGKANIGNVHFPPNGQSDYDYANTKYVVSNCDDWYNYPNFTGTTKSVNRTEWDPTGSYYHKNYLKWWYNHMPHKGGKGPDNYLMNWWRYLTDVDQFKGWNGNLYYSSGIPSVRITSPTNGSAVSGKVNIIADASADGALGRVDFYVDGVFHGYDTVSPYTFEWDTAGLTGAHTITAKAYELQNQTEAVSSDIVLNVQNSAISGSALSGAFGISGVSITAAGTIPKFVRATNSTSQSIPDNSNTGVTSTINIPETGVATSVVVGMTINHNKRNDLQVYLKSPDGTQITLVNRPTSFYANDKDLITFFPTVSTPAGSLSALNGLQINGNWQLIVKDRASSNTGTLAGWSLTIGYNFASTHNTVTAENGSYSFNELPAGAYTLTPSKAGYTFTPANITVTVGPNATDVNFNGTAPNSPPVIEAIPNQTINEEEQFNYQIIASDPNPGQILTYSMSATSTGAAINPTTGLFTWTPAENHGPGAYSFNITVTDNGNPVMSSSALLRITVREVNKPPTANNQSLTTEQEIPLPITLTASDADIPANSFTYTITSSPSHGILSGTAPDVTYTSATGFVGTDSFMVKASDGLAESAEAQISINVVQAPAVTLTGTVLLDGWLGVLTQYGAKVWVDNGLPQNTTLNLMGNTGAFTVQVPGTGSHVVRVKPNAYLSNSIIITTNRVNLNGLFSGPLGFGLIPGDVNLFADNLINHLDIELIADNLGYAGTFPTEIGFTDTNGDLVVDDFDLMNAVIHINEIGN